MSRFVTHPGRMLALVALVAGVAAGSSNAQARMLTPATAKATRHAQPADDVETRIKTLHSQLRITPAQEEAFDNVAQVMRTNAAALKALRNQKADTLESANAVEQVDSYAALIDAHADGVHKFVPAFKTLYDSLSPDQKKAADVAFRKRARQATERGKP